ncbi:MAG: type II toxin-antitoxin system VapC family toxin [Mycobacteriaceae bacterium]
MIAYLDTSAAMKLLVEEPESAALVMYVQSNSDEFTLVGSWLLHTELHCAAHRHPNDVDAAAVRLVLEVITLLDLTRGDLLTAGTMPGGLRSHDALHLAVALRVGVDELITYDAELHRAAGAAGLRVVHPD